jgi:hypothetical protein
MFEWHRLSTEQRLNFLNETSKRTGYLNNVIEKDWWVTVALKAVFDTPWSKFLVFKGGTSLSKAWNLIERFSEDIDLAIDRTALGFPWGTMTSSQIKKLRVRSSAFVENEFVPDIRECLLRIGIDQKQFDLEVLPDKTSDTDPRIIKLNYRSITPDDKYVRDHVLIEIGARSLREPCSKREIKSILTEHFPDLLIADPVFEVDAVHDYAIPICKECPRG